MASTAYYINKTIWSLNLPTLDRCLLAHIELNTKRFGYCNTSDIELSEEMSCSIHKIKKTIKKLKSLGLISVHSKQLYSPVWGNLDQICSNRIIVSKSSSNISSGINE